MLKEEIELVRKIAKEIAKDEISKIPITTIDADEIVSKVLVALKAEMAKPSKPDAKSEKKGGI